jgi:hypothetical protein
MYVEVGAPHHQPHFHAYFQNKSAVFSIHDIEMIAGMLDRKQQRLVEAWAEMHREELLENWNRLQAGKLPLKIAPLR